MSNYSLPKKLKPYFWEYSFKDLSLESDRDLIIRRILSSGSWEVIQWLRKQIGDVQLRNWIINKKGRGLNPSQLRFWELVLDLPHNKVNQWVKTARISVWGQK